MRPIRAILIYVLAVFAGGALLAPWLYRLAQAVAPSSGIAHSPFHRYLDRSLLIVALAGIWPLLRSLGAISWREVGMTKPQGKGKSFSAGLALGFGSLALAAIIALLCKGRTFQTDLRGGELALKLAGAAGTALVVAFVEELLFRGAIFGALRKIWDWKAALLVSSMVYALVHFLQKTEVTGPVVWSSGLELLPGKLAGFANAQQVIPGFFNLTLAGIILGWGYQRTGNLYFSVGLHAGWIFWLKSYGLFTQSVSRANDWLWGTQKLIDGWLALPIVALTLLIFLNLPLPRQAENAP